MNASGSSEGFLGYRAGSYDVTFSLRKGFCLVRHRDYVIKACDTCDMTCEHVSRQGELWPFFPCTLDRILYRIFYHRFQTIFDRIKTELSAAT